MKTELKALLENAVLTDEVKTAISEAWENSKAQLKEQAIAEVREEYAAKFDHDKGLLIEAVDRMVNEKIVSVVGKYSNAKLKFEEAKANYAKKIVEDSKKIEQFALSKIFEEVKEFADGRKQIEENMSNVEKYLINRLSKEVKAIHEEKKKLIAQRAELIAEGKKLLEATKEKFVKNSAAKVSEWVEESLSKQMKEFGNQIQEARENMFGRKIFESFVTEYMTSLHAEHTELGKALKKIKVLESTVSKAKKVIDNKNKLVEDAQKETRIARDLAERTKVMTRLMSPLPKEKKAVMEEMLSKVETVKLTESFNKYLPIVMEGKSVAPTRSTLQESRTREITGDKKQLVETTGKETINEIDRIVNIANYK